MFDILVAASVSVIVVALASTIDWFIALRRGSSSMYVSRGGRW